VGQAPCFEIKSKRNNYVTGVYILTEGFTESAYSTNETMTDVQA
jgi:hypothetical protein